MADRSDVPGPRRTLTPSRRFVRSGDGFLHCDDGHVRWGRFGAAGVLFVGHGDRGPEALVQLRSARAHEGGTWSCPGGAIDEGEKLLEQGSRGVHLADQRRRGDEPARADRERAFLSTQSVVSFYDPTAGTQPACPERAICWRAALPRAVRSSSVGCAIT